MHDWEYLRHWPHFPSKYSFQQGIWGLGNFYSIPALTMAIISNSEGWHPWNIWNNLLFLIIMLGCLLQCIDYVCQVRLWQILDFFFIETLANFVELPLHPIVTNALFFDVLNTINHTSVKILIIPQIGHLSLGYLGVSGVFGKIVYLPSFCSPSVSFYYLKTS